MVDINSENIQEKIEKIKSHITDDVSKEHDDDGFEKGDRYNSVVITSDIIKILMIEDDKEYLEKKEQLINRIMKLFDNELLRIAYSVIAKTAYEEMEKNDNSLMLEIAINRLDDIEKEMDDKYKVFILKFMEHFSLAMQQYKLIGKKVEDIKRHLKLVNHQLTESSFKVQEYENKVKNSMLELKNTKDSLYGQLISILAIFTAIAFVMFGGVNAISTCFGELKEGTQLDLGKISILASIFCLGMINVTYLFLRFILYILDKDGSNSSMNLVFILCNVVFIIIIFFGFIIVYSINETIVIRLILYVILFLIVICLVYFIITKVVSYFNKKKKEEAESFFRDKINTMIIEQNERLRKEKVKTDSKKEDTNRPKG